MSKKYKNSKYLVLLIAITLLTSNVAYGREGELNDDSTLRGNVEVQNKSEDSSEDGDDKNKGRLEKRIDNSAFREEAKKLKDEYEAKLDVLKAKLSAQKDQIKAKKDETKLNNRKASVVRWGNAVENIQKLTKKLEEVIKKAKTAGIDTSGAEVSLNEANAKVVQIEANAKLMMDIIVKPLPMSEADKAKLTELSKSTQIIVKQTNELLQKASKDLRNAMQAKRKLNKDNKTN